MSPIHPPPSPALHAAGSRALLRLSIALLLASLGAFAGSPATACDLCAVYTATELTEGRTGFRLGIAEQYTYFGTLQQDSKEVPNELDQNLSSSITQLIAGYQVTRRLGAQLTLPLIYRSWRRPVGSGIQSSTKASIGDMSLLATFVPFSAVSESGVFRTTLIGGLKLPTGSAAFLGEEEGGMTEDDGAETGGGGPHPMAHEHHGAASGIHGHNLTFGTGSVDGIVGGSIFGSYGRFFASGSLQYMLRTPGSFDYTFADDLMWYGGPGAYLLLAHDRSLAVQAVLSGATKGKDTQDGAPVDDSALTNLFIGPNLSFTWRTQLSAEAGADLPVVRHNTGLEIVPDYRVRAAVLWRF